MKLEKGSLSAIIETLCFVLGAVFFIMVIAIPSNPIWALVAGIFCGLTGAIIWSCSLILRAANKVGHKIHNQIERTVVNQVDAKKVAKSILEDEDNTYELHRADSYDDLTDEIMEQAENETENEVEPATEPESIPETKQKPEPISEPTESKSKSKKEVVKQPTKKEKQLETKQEKLEKIEAQQRAEKRKQGIAQLKELMSNSSETKPNKTEK